METPKPLRRARGRAAKSALLLLAACALLAALPRLRPAAATLPAPRDAERRILDILRREDLRFLVTDRIAAQVVAESDRNSPLLGRREGQLVARTTMHYGVDLAKLAEKDVSRDGPAVVVAVPEPEELDFAVDLNSMRYSTRRSGLHVAADWILDRDQRAELRARFHDAARAYLREERLLPARDEIVARLNAAAGAIARTLGVEVRFR